MSCAWNSYCVAVNNKFEAIKAMAYTGASFLEEDPTNPVLVMLHDMLWETVKYYHLDMLIFERDNYITMIEDDMERNGDSWIFYLSQTLQDKTVFPWLKSKGYFDNIPVEEQGELEARL